MSGSTRVTQRGALYSLSFETPCIDFAEPPEPSRPRAGPTHEQTYHARERERFEALLAPFDPGLGEALAELRARPDAPPLVAWTPELPVVASTEEWAARAHAQRGGGPCRIGLRIRAPDGSALSEASIELALAALPPRADLERLEQEVSSTIVRIHEAEQRRIEAQRPPGPSAPLDAGERRAPGARGPWLCVGAVALVVICALLARGCAG